MAAYGYKGVEYKFVNTQAGLLEELKCAICLELVSNPVQTSCGHLFCGKCIKGTNTCPIDRKQFTSHPDNFNDRRIRNFKVKCPNKGRGCQWEGNLGDAEKHTSTVCSCQIVKCCNEGCDEEIERRHLVDHMHNKCPERTYNCPFCAEEGMYCEVTTAHFTKCEELPLTCPAGCGKRGLVRRDMALHLSADCPNELVPCTFAIAGCQQIVKRKYLQQHLLDKDQHLDAVLSSYASLALLVKDILYKRTPNIPLSLRDWLQSTPTCYPRPPWVFKIEGYQEKKNRQRFSDPVYSHFGGYRMLLCVDANGLGDGEGTHVSVYVLLLQGDNDDNLKWPFKGTIKVSLLNQLEDGQHHTERLWTPDCNVSENARGRVRVGKFAKCGWGNRTFIPHQDLTSKGDKNCQYLKDNTLFFRVDSIEPKLG